ncbi:1221_t:CDS:2 [Funneliformis caledonium]|uniref:1221_t:CDS:1 n=1 Tax=Funneliformis caledonium TaxID=1117310 RepID=A0A9N9CGQ7_9GLOM|nr:1221_t:CDS:2 [Funneliformis caledonium]
MNTKNILSTPIWYKFEGRHANKIIELPGDDFIDFLEAVKTKEGLSCSASTLTLRAKKETVIYTLNETNYQNDFSEFVKAFEISKQNPIEVMFSSEDQGSTSSTGSQAERDEKTYKSLSSWQKKKYNKLANENMKAMYLKFIREELEAVGEDQGSTSSTGSQAERDEKTYKSLSSWKKKKYNRLANENLKAMYLQFIREEREENSNILNSKNQDDESIKRFLLILNAAVYGIQLIVVLIKIVRICLFYDQEHFDRMYFILVPVAFGILISVLMGIFVVSPNIAISWVDAGLEWSELHYKLARH